jgi:hypothetical protein
MYIPFDIMDSILVYHGPLHLAYDKKLVATCRIQRYWRSLKMDWIEQDVQFRWKKINPPYYATIEPFASLEWKYGRFVPQSETEAYLLYNKHKIHIPNKHIIVRKLK